MSAIVPVALAASPSPAVGGDPRSSGEGPGLVGEPALAILAVVAIAIVTIGLTTAYVRLTDSRSGRGRFPGLSVRKRCGRAPRRTRVGHHQPCAWPRMTFVLLARTVRLVGCRRQLDISSTSERCQPPCPPVPSTRPSPSRRPLDSSASTRTRSGRGVMPAASATTGSIPAATAATGWATSSGSLPPPRAGLHEVGQSGFGLRRALDRPALELLASPDDSDVGVQPTGADAERDRHRADLDLLAELARIGASVARTDTALAEAAGAILDHGSHLATVVFELRGDRLVPRASAGSDDVHLVELPRDFGALGMAARSPANDPTTGHRGGARRGHLGRDAGGRDRDPGRRRRLGGPRHRRRRGRRPRDTRSGSPSSRRPGRRRDRRRRPGRRRGRPPSPSSRRPASGRGRHRQPARPRPDPVGPRRPRDGPVRGRPGGRLPAPRQRQRDRRGHARPVAGLPPVRPRLPGPVPAGDGGRRAPAALRHRLSATTRAASTSARPSSRRGSTRSAPRRSSTDPRSSACSTSTTTRRTPGPRTSSTRWPPSRPRRRSRSRTPRTTRRWRPGRPSSSRSSSSASACRG